MGPIVPQEYGGMGRGTVEYSIISEELARAGLFGPQPTIQAEKHLLASGTEEQKECYLPRLARGQWIAAIAISEPNVGSSFEAMETTAVRTDDTYLINGRKSHINFAADAALILLYARTEKGLSIFIVERGTLGISFRKGDPIGRCNQPSVKRCILLSPTISRSQVCMKVLYSIAQRADIYSLWWVVIAARLTTCQRT